MFAFCHCQCQSCIKERWWWWVKTLTWQTHRTKVSLDCQMSTEKWCNRCRSVLTYTLSFPVGLSSDAWRPSFSHSSVYGTGLNKLGGGPLTLINIKEDKLSTVSLFRTAVSLAFIHEKPRSHSAEDTGNKQTRCNSSWRDFPTRRVLFLYCLKSSNASLQSTCHSFASFSTCSSPNRARWSLIDREGRLPWLGW